MAISVTNIGASSTTVGATVAIAVPAGGVPAGALIVVGVSDTSTSLVGNGVADTVNTYTAVTAVDNNGLIANGFGQLFYSPNSGTLTSANSITYTKAVTAVSAGVSSFYATGIATTSPLDTAVSATAAGTGSSPTVTSGTPSVTGELFVGLWTDKATLSTTYSQDTTHSWVSPFAISGNTTGGQVAGGTQVNAGTGTIIFHPTANRGNPNTVQVYGFKAAGGATVENLPPFQNWAA